MAWPTILLFCICFIVDCTWAEDRLLTGADRILEDPYISWIDGKRVGLITNHTGVNHQLQSLPDLFRDCPRITLAALFAPEHGFRGSAQAGEQVATSPRVFSLYGQHRRPTTAMMSNVDVLIYDIQDVGVRFYTFVSTMLECMKSAASSGKPFIVLDRPNPIDGTRIAGPVLEDEWESFVGIARIPIRYGMTPAELALLLKSEVQLDLDLRIVPISGWKRQQWFNETGLQWIAPSPNMPTLTTATVYPGFCLMEGTNLSEGRGTTRPFELIGSPWLNANTICAKLNRLALAGVHFRPQPFTPVFSKYKGELCQGIQVHVLDAQQFLPIPSALQVLRQIRLQHRDQLKIEGSSFDRLAGNTWIREMLNKGKSVELIVERWQADLEEFRIKRAKYLLY